MSPLRSLRFVVIAAILSVCSIQAIGQTHLSSHRRDIQSITSRDFWYAFPQNYSGNTGNKLMMLYISSSDSTVANVQLTGGTVQTFAIQPGQTTTINIPLTWEMTTSDLVEDKVIHVWSDDAALFVDVNQHNDATSDATYVIPSAGWGKAYVVASYASLFAGVGSSVFDQPSEFIIISNQNSTEVTITPATDIRDSKDQLSHSAGTPFRVTLNAGQCVQYKAMPSQREGIDVTGTQILSSNPIGLVGASQCSNIPTDYPYCDFICEMIPPVRTWGSDYYTAPLEAGRKGGDTYLVINSQPNQTIERTSPDTRSTTITDTFATLAKPYTPLFRPDVAKPSHWQSSAPFLLMHYSNSATYPDNSNKLYDPFMMAVNPIEQLSTPVIFNVLLPAPGPIHGPAYTWNSAIVARSGVAIYVDNSLLTSVPVWDDGAYAIYTIANMKVGQHIVTSDSGVSVDVYGSAFDESVGYAGVIGVSSILSADTLSPIVMPKDLDPKRTRLTVEDKGSDATGLSQFEVQQLTNMTLVASPGFVAGSGNASSSFDLVVSDPNRSAHAKVRVLDLAGNYTIVDKSYEPNGVQAGVSIPAKNLVVSSNPTAAITYELAQESNVQIDLYDILGNRALAVWNAHESAGSHTVTPDLRLLADGAYFYRIETIDGTRSGKLLLKR